MSKFQILAHDNENLQPTCIYRCGKGGVHVFYGYVNIGMPHARFRLFTEAVVNALDRITAGVWSGYVTLHYGTTSLILPEREFVSFASTVREAATTLEDCGEVHEGSEEDEVHCCSAEAPSDNIYQQSYRNCLN